MEDSGSAARALSELARLHGKRLSAFRVQRMEQSVLRRLEDIFVADVQGEQGQLVSALAQDIKRDVPTTILVTGGAGFIGSNLCKRLLASPPGYRVVVLDSLTYAGNPANLDGVDEDRLEFVDGNINDPGTVSAVVARCDVIVNAAAESHVDRVPVQGTGRAFLNSNFEGVRVLLKAAVASNIELFLQISTDEVYGTAYEGEAGFREDAPLSPRNPHAVMKACADNSVAAFRSDAALPTIVARLCNVYGPFQYPEKLVPLLITNAIQDLPFPIYGTGTQEREWLYIDDCLDALELLIEKGDTDSVYNVGNRDGGRRKNIDIANAILEGVSDTKSDIRYVEDRPLHDERYALDSSKVHELGWEPTTGFEQGLAKTIEWYRERRNWWLPLRAELAKSRFGRERYDEEFLEAVPS